MKLAFWKSKPARRGRSGAVGGEADPDDARDDLEADEQRAAQLRVRARRRLIGATALLLLVVIVVPMVLDPAPRPVADNIPIDLPSDRTPFAPKVAPPPADAAPAAAADAGGLVPAAPGSAADSAAPPESSGAAAAPKPDAKHKASGRAEGAGGHLWVQAAALSRESSARELADRLGKSGLSPLVQRVESNGSARYRVRLGPFATREEAEHARARLHALGVSSNIVGAG